MSKPRYPITIELLEKDGNAFNVLGIIRRTLQRSHREDWQEIWQAFYDEATSSDYDHLLGTAMVWFDVC